MKNIKRFFALLLVVVLTVAAVATVSAASITFSDTDGHWAWEEGYIPYLVEKDVLNGYKLSESNYIFKPDGEVKRSEFIKMLDETFGLVETKAVSFSDVKSSDWFCVYFQKAAAQGYILDYGTSCDPEGKITREEAISLLVRYLALDPEKKAEASTFADYDTINTKYRDYVLEAIDAELIEGYKQSNGSYLFKPQNTLTRAEALTILYRAAGCIYNKNYSYLRDEGAADKNSVITKSGVSIVSQTLTGRTIVSEGAKDGTVSFSSSEIKDDLYVRGNSIVYLDTCTAENIEVKGNGGLYVKDTTIDNLVVNKGMTITLKDDAVIKNLTINPMAANVKITGAGKIENIVVKSSGLVSSVVPEHYEFVNNITATFDGKEYGQNSVSDIYKVEPFISSDKSDYYLELTAKKDGSVYYYLSDKNVVPTVQEFLTAYKNAKTGTSGYIDVKADKPVSKKTCSVNTGKSYPYVVMIFQEGTKTSDPIVLTTSSVDSNGFSTVPYINSADNTVKFKTSVKGTVSYYYTDNVAGLTLSKFNSEYAATENALKGSKAVTAKELSSISITAAYADKFNYIVFEFKSESGIPYVPVYVTLADNGFTTVPAIKNAGVISYKANTNGTIYYYYSKTEGIPSTTDFITNWNNSANGGGQKTVKKDTAETFNYSSTYAGSKPYLIIALRDEAGNFKLPVCVELGNVSGFISLPKMKDDTTVTFTTDISGKVYYYLAKKDTVPTVDNFEALYEAYELAGGIAGNSTTTGSSYYANYITVPKYSMTGYQYLVLMLKDNNGNAFAPTVLSLVYEPAQIIGGFSVEPYIKDGYLCFKTDTEAKVCYFYTSENVLDSTTFYTEYNKAFYRGNETTKPNELTKVQINFVVASRPECKNIAVAILNDTVFGTPIILDATKNTEIPAANSGLTYSLAPGFSEYVSVTSYYNGTLYYFSTDDFDETKADVDISKAWSISVSTGSAKPIPTDGKKYLVLMLSANSMLYPKAVVDTTTGSSYVEPKYDGSSNSSFTNIQYTPYNAENKIKYAVGENCIVYYTLVADTIPINPILLQPSTNIRGTLGSDMANFGHEYEFDYSMWANIADQLPTYEHVYIYIQCVGTSGAIFYTPVKVVTLK